MPIFEYKCERCGEITELLEKTGSKAKKSCAHCGGKKLVKQFSTFAPMIKQGQSKRCHGCSDDTCPHAGL